MSAPNFGERDPSPDPSPQKPNNDDIANDDPNTPKGEVEGGPGNNLSD